MCWAPDGWSVAAGEKKKSQKTDLIAEMQSFGINNYEVFYALQVVF